MLQHRLPARRKALAIILSAVLLTATFTTAFVLPNVAVAEVIIIESCHPGLIELRSGSTVTCIDPNMPDGHGSNQDIPGDDRGEGATAGGGKRPRPSAAELRRRRRCRGCMTAQETCLLMAEAAGGNCVDVASATATRRCDLDQSGGAYSATTPWGCTIASLAGSRCPAAESPWQHGAQWNTEGKFERFNKPAVEQRCLEAWQQNHPNGSTSETNVVRGSYQVKFTLPVGAGGGGFGGERTFTATYAWDGRHGYLGVCNSVEDELRHACIGAASQCIAQNQCSEEDLQ